MRWFKDRRRAQAGTTLIELLVSVVIMGLALVLIVGTFSTGLLDASLAKRNTTVGAVAQYELGRIGASSYSSSATPYSECFATEGPTSPTLVSAFGAPCPGTSFTLRADVRWAPGQTSNSQVWTVTVSSWPAGTEIGQPLSLYKVNR